MKKRRTSAEGKPDQMKPYWLGVAFGLLVINLMMFLPQIYFLEKISALTSWPGLWSRLAVCIVWTAVIFCLLWLLYTIAHLHKPYHNHWNMFDRILDSLDRIAQGDYNVFVPKDNHHTYNELGEKINHLAKQLSNMEHIRQSFVSNVSHEIQSPLTSISGFAQLLRKEELTVEEREHYLDVIQSETARMSKLSDNLLRLSILDSDGPSLNPNPFRLDKQVENALLAQEPQWAAKNLELDVDLAELTYTGDEELLLQVWQNLIQNAIKFTPNHGHIYVGLARKEEHTVCFTIRNDGTLIPPEDMVHIFERFYKVDKARDRKVGGNGLGLPLVKRITELHSGKIEVESEEHSGTTFIVNLPLTPVEN